MIALRNATVKTQTPAREGEGAQGVAAASSDHAARWPQGVAAASSDRVEAAASSDDVWRPQHIRKKVAELQAQQDSLEQQGTRQE